MDLQIGSTVGDYQIVGILGAGGMGKVYKVRNVISDRAEAMKVLLPDLATAPDLADRFLREIKVQASLEHPNIAALHTALRVDNQLLMLMEFVDGITLEQKLKDGPLPVEQAVDYMAQALSALEYAHARGVIHRDIKPANMMLTPQGTIKLMDFGIAKGAGDHKLTMTGTTMGSLYYMSPEQIQGAANLDARADLYSLGVSLYEVVTGKRPFDGDSQFAIMSAHLEKTPVPPVQLDPRLPAALNDIILLSVAKDPNQRFQTAGAFRNALASVATGGGVAPAAAAVASAITAPVPPPVAAPLSPPQAQAAPPMPVPVRSPGKSRRGLWMALGGVATAAAVIAAIQFAPWKGSKAAAPATTTVTTPAPTVSPVPAPVASEPAPNPAPPAVGNTPSQTLPVQTQPVAIPGKTPGTQPKRLPGIAQQQPVQQPIQQRVQQPIQQPVQQPVTQQGYPQNTPQSQAPPPVQQAAPARPQVPQQMREMLMSLRNRADGIRESLDTLRRTEQAQGRNVSSKFSEPAGLMNNYLHAADDAVRNGDPTAAQGFMDKAERQIDILEKLFNR